MVLIKKLWTEWSQVLFKGSNGVQDKVHFAMNPCVMLNLELLMRNYLPILLIVQLGS